MLPKTTENFFTQTLMNPSVYTGTPKDREKTQRQDGATRGEFLLTENSFSGTNASNVLFVNGGQVALSNPGSLVDDPGTGVVTDTLYVGQRAGTAGAGWGLNGDFAELLVFNRVLTDAERNTVGSYLADKYGLTTAYVVPEPNTLVLLVVGLFGLLAYAWRKRK